jgi:hypothetical protein
MKERVKLTINTEPKKALIKIIGMKRAYKKGMKLNVGQYKIRVTSPTYTPQELIVHLEKDKNVFDVVLESSIEQIECQDVQQDFPLEFINRNYLKKLNNCTYQLAVNADSSTPFKLLVAKNSHKSKHLMKARLAILTTEASGNSALTIELIKPRQARITAGSSGISDVPQSIRSDVLRDLKQSSVRLTILDATFSY